MKTFIISVMFAFATFFPILFVPLLALTILVLLIAAPHLLKHGLGIWSNPEHQ